MDTPIKLDFLDLGLALGMIALAIGLSAWQRLGLAGSLALAAARAIIQLLMLGIVLEFVFAGKQPLLVVGFLLLLLTLAAIATRNRISRKIPRLFPVVWVALFASTAIALLYTQVFVLRQPEAWIDPRYAITFGGLILGNTLNGGAIAGERFVSSLQNNPWEIETHLCLGATPQQAIDRYRRDAIRSGFLPTLNATMTVGLVALPALTGGQLLGGISPLTAVAYQIVVALMLMLANLIGTVAIVNGLSKLVFDEGDRLKF
ncbi:MAG TPA: iron export ABC transporter permease subunit FetB [Oscillatoriales cyanobacterium M59_W2019_021]|nr:MAG: iron export ABC transporter permease subunit FetB [Cyanobacteria bacterium J055]HIK33011.1 iron export ABC transporter permease subunit FetB [Oscillatoriales cyanobacterium M4454_W2019_049]HIK52026.1 iron export ABC transporter permease subunit FetB [Oscillatoriales cyanobacterium M59_W2019_021]